MVKIDKPLHVTTLLFWRRSWDIHEKERGNTSIGQKPQIIASLLTNVEAK